MKITLSSKYIRKQLYECRMGELVQVETGTFKGTILYIVPGWAVTLDGSHRMWHMETGTEIMTDFVRVFQKGDSVTLTVE